MLDFKQVNDILSGLTLLKFFPSGMGAQLALAGLVGRMANTEDEVRWLVQRTLAVCNEWPGPLVIRQIFCSRFQPADGVGVFSTLQYPAGLPPEKQIEPVAPLQLPPGHLVSMDPELERAVREIAAAKDLNGPHRGHVGPIPVNPGYKPVTKEDVDKALDEIRRLRALEQFKKEDVQ